jgi:hypothetical protein
MNFRHRQLGIALALAIASTATLISGCGGGGDGVSGEDTLSGTALTGAALVGATVTIRNGQGQDCASATSDANGAWSTGVKSCGASPFLIKATGTQDGAPVIFYSAATAEDVNAASTSGKTVNVSQITDLIVKIALKTDDPGTSSSTALADGLTQSKLATASKDALTALVPASVLSDAEIDVTKDIRTMAVVAGSKKQLDKLHDRVTKVETIKVGTVLSFIVIVPNFDAASGASAALGATLDTAAASAKPVPKTGEINGVEVHDVATVATVTDPKELVRGEIMQMVRNWDKVYASDVPATYDVANVFTDSCYLSDGWDRAYGTSRWAEDLAGQRAANRYRVGATRSNLIVDSIGKTTNADGSVTRRAKVRYDVNYLDGTKAIAAENFLVYGNSAPVCTEFGLSVAGTSKEGWRFVGEGRRVAANVDPRSMLFVHRSIVDNSSKGANSRQNRLQFNIFDYRGLGIAYVIVKGPALPASGVKMLMPVTLRDAPELQGKTFNYLNGKTSDQPKMCFYRDVANVVQRDAAQADCLANGGSRSYWLLSDSDIAALPADAVYTIALYNDDGWKTVNGQSGKTPVYTYTDTLPQKPFTTAELAESAFPILTGDSLATLAAFKGTSATISLALTPTTPPSGAKPMAYTGVFAYSEEHPSTAGYWPSRYQDSQAYPAATATSVNSVIPGKLSGADTVGYAEVQVVTGDRNGRTVRTDYFWD